MTNPHIDRLSEIAQLMAEARADQARADLRYAEIMEKLMDAIIPPQIMGTARKEPATRDEIIAETLEAGFRTNYAPEDEEPEGGGEADEAPAPKVRKSRPVNPCCGKKGRWHAVDCPVSPMPITFECCGSTMAFHKPSCVERMKPKADHIPEAAKKVEDEPAEDEQEPGEPETPEESTLKEPGKPVEPAAEVEAGRYENGAWTCCGAATKARHLSSCPWIAQERARTIGTAPVRDEPLEWVSRCCEADFKVEAIGGGREIKTCWKCGKICESIRAKTTDGARYYKCRYCDDNANLPPNRTVLPIRMVYCDNCKLNEGLVETDRQGEPL